MAGLQGRQGFGKGTGEGRRHGCILQQSADKERGVRRVQVSWLTFHVLKYPRDATLSAKPSCQAAFIDIYTGAPRFLVDILLLNESRKPTKLLSGLAGPLRRRRGL